MSETTESNQVAGYVPSDEAVEAGAPHVHPWDPGALSLDEWRQDNAAAVLANAVPVEVARVLGEVRALADEWLTRMDDDVDKSSIMSAGAAADDLRAVLDTVGVPAREVPATIKVPSEEAMFDLLSGLNVSGVHPELPCITQPGRYGVAPFLATLTDPDAAHVNYIVSDERGRSRCMVGCDNCGSEDVEHYQPTYPVIALIGEWPDADRCRDDEISTWWLDTVGVPAQVEGGPLTGKVRALHRPVSWTGVTGKCASEDCDHPERQVDCPEVVFEVCNHCIGIVEPFAPEVGPYPTEVMWPCPTAVVLDTVPAQVDEAATGGQSS